MLGVVNRPNQAESGPQPPLGGPTFNISLDAAVAIMRPLGGQETPGSHVGRQCLRLVSGEMNSCRKEAAGGPWPLADREPDGCLPPASGDLRHMLDF